MASYYFSGHRTAVQSKGPTSRSLSFVQVKLFIKPKLDWTGFLKRPSDFASQRKRSVRGSITGTTGFLCNKIDQRRKYECSEAVESNLVKLETSRTVILLLRVLSSSLPYKFKINTHCMSSRFFKLCILRSKKFPT